MRDLVLLFLAALATALATGLGVVPVLLLGDRARARRPLLWGLAIGLMGVASVVGLLQPALAAGSAVAVAAGLLAGAGFLAATRWGLRSPHLHVGALHGAGARTSILVWTVLFVHSLPEGLAIGTAYASTTAGLGLFVILAIALQNVPEGTSVAIPMAEAGFGGARQFWAAVATSLPQPVGAVAAFVAVRQVEALLPFSFAFAGGAMLALVAIELIPSAFTAAGWRQALAGSTAGAGVMLALSFALGV